MSGSVPIIQDPESDDPTSSSMQREQRNHIQQQGQYGPNNGQLVPVTQRAVDIRALMTKSETLTRWYPMIVGRDGTGISVFGYLPSKNEQMITASIFHVHAGRFLVTTANDAYYLDGPIDRQSALQLGFPEGFVNHFSNGFPSEWEVHVRLARKLLYGEQPSLSGSENSGSASAGTGAGRSAPVCDSNLLPQQSQPYQHNDHVPQPPPNEPVVELPNDQSRSKKEKSKKRRTMEMIDEKDDREDEENSFEHRRKRKPQLDFSYNTTAPSDESSLQIKKKKGKQADAGNQSNKKKAYSNKTPDLNGSIHQSRSGRVVHPPLASWAGERIVRDAEGNAVRYESPTTRTMHTAGVDKKKAKELTRAAGVASPRGNSAKERINKKPLTAAEKPGAKKFVQPKIVSYSDSEDYDDSDGEKERTKENAALPPDDFETPMFVPRKRQNKYRRVDSDDVRLTRSMKKRVDGAVARQLETEWDKEDEKIRYKDDTNNYTETPVTNYKKRAAANRKKKPVKVKLQKAKPSKKNKAQKSTANSASSDSDESNDESEESADEQSSERGDRHAEEEEEEEEEDTVPEPADIIKKKPKNLTESELSRLKLALLSYRIRTDEDWVKVAKALKNEREPEEYKKAAIAKLNWKEPRPLPNSTLANATRTPLALRTEVRNKVGTLAFERQADKAARSYMFGGNNTTTLGNLTSAQNQNQPDEEDDFDIPSADESLLEALRSPPQQAVSKKTKSKSRQTFEPAPIDDSPVSSPNSFNLALTDSSERNRRQRYLRNLVKSRFAPSTNRSKPATTNAQKSKSKKAFRNALNELDAVRNAREKENRDRDAEEDEEDDLGLSLDIGDASFL